MWFLLLVGNGCARAERRFKGHLGIHLENLHYFSARGLWLTLRRYGESLFRCQRAEMGQLRWCCGSMFETSSLPGPITNELLPSGHDNPGSTFWPFVAPLTRRKAC